MEPGPEVDILMVGHFAKDRVVIDRRSETVSGGGVYYGSVALRRIGVSVAVVTRLHPADFLRLEALTQEGVQVFANPALETSGIENHYHSADMERRICKPLGFAGPFQAAELPELKTRIYAIVPIIAGEVDLDLLKTLAARGAVALDVQGFVRVRSGDALVFRPWPDIEAGLAGVTYLKLDRAEAELLTGQTDLVEAARRLAGYGPQEIIITESAGVIAYVDGKIYQAPFTSRSLVGRTGRGDTCFAVYVGHRLTTSPDSAVRLAAAITSLKQEQPGPWRGTLAEAEARLADNEFLR
jgi:sugar/nucleoside kinase (ribokinase family)